MSDKSQKKALRALRLYENNHSYKSIAELVGIKHGSVKKRIELGKRLRDAGFKED